ncbi:MAG: hypothetical protein KBF69_05155, partial [Saprospiraceae bacterium]|nr:hypothetical protein [Saprospiraceae bacterium]
LTSIIMNLDHLESVSEEIIAMSNRHTGYGVKPAHYEMVGSALLWTLQKGLGAEWSDDIENAWIACYQSLADTMIQNS